MVSSLGIQEQRRLAKRRIWVRVNTGRELSVQTNSVFSAHTDNGLGEYGEAPAEIAGWLAWNMFQAIYEPIMWNYDHTTTPGVARYREPSRNLTSTPCSGCNRCPSLTALPNLN